MSGRFMAKLAVLGLAQGGILRLAQHPAALAGFRNAGIPESVAAPLGAAELLCLTLCLIPRTTLAGAALLTAYLVAATAAGILSRFEFLLALAVLPVIWLGPGLGASGFRILAPAFQRFGANIE